MKKQKLIYYFGSQATEGNRDMRELLGGKGANLAEMTSIGLPVPPGFTITTACCADYHAAGKKLTKSLIEDVHRNMLRLEKDSGKTFGSSENPLLVSVRSGAAVSMPGMMDTVLNLGLNDRTVKGLARLTGNERFALDAYRRLINMYGDVVMGIDHHHFETAFDRVKKQYKVSRDTDLDTDGLGDLLEAYKAIYKKHTRKPFPQDPYKQLQLAIEAVFRSWNIPRAITYRRLNAIQGLLGTAVNVQSMVFGNMGDDSGTGVAFTRDPATGQNRFYGEFLINAQGEDVVAGIRTPLPVMEMKKWRPGIYRQLLQVKRTLEAHYLDMQDIEFTIERGRLFILQTRTGKRTGQAAVKIAVDMVREKKISRKTALLRVPANDLNQLLLPSFDPAAKRTVLTTGLPASPGAASGYPVFTADEADARAADGESVILVRRDTSPEDIHGMHAATGILTSTGGSTSHAAVVARGWGKCCVAGASELNIDDRRKRIRVNGVTITGKDIISIDGTSGEILMGEVPKSPPVFTREFKTLMKWADGKRKLRVRTNADTTEDAEIARRFGAEGIGLCRTEHMFFGEDRIMAMRRMILADNPQHRRQALKKLLPYQRRDFYGLFSAMKGLPVTIRLLDPPLHEFLPRDEKTLGELARIMKVPVTAVRNRVNQLHESNPMMGHRGCRLSISFPEILEMQVRAIVEAAIDCRRKRIDARPEIMIPLIGLARELALLREQVIAIIADIRREKRYRGKLDIPVGTMIEVPNAALIADQIAGHADFFSFGTNDLTQMTMGYSRDDIGSFIPEYINKGLLNNNPFQTIDGGGVAILVEMAVTGGRSKKTGLKCGICGEHGGDPESIAFFQKANLDYISCSPFRVPVARLAAAQAKLLDE